MILSEYSDGLSKSVLFTITWLLNFSRTTKRVLAISIDTFFIGGSLVLALMIRVPEQVDRWFTLDYAWSLIIFCTMSTLIFGQFGQYRVAIRYMNISALSGIFFGAVTSSITLAVFSFLGQIGLPRSIPFVYFGLLLTFVGGIRLLARGLLMASNKVDSDRVLIYGAGAAGRQLCVSLQNGAEYVPVAFVDDDPRIQKSFVLGVEVFSPANLKKLVEREGICKVLFAVPSLSKAQKTAILNSVETLGIEMLTIPSSGELVSGKVSVSSLRAVEIDDLLGREAVCTDPELLTHVIEGATVLVTGAGGSIGGELTRQIARLGCKRIIIFEQSEFQLYKMEQQLSQSENINVVPILGSVLDEAQIDKLFKKYQIDIVFHAAAYKHVPMVEKNLASGMLTNILGTRRIAEAAIRYGVCRFVLVSTDKAVRPTNAMGASKRLAEMLIQVMASETSQTILSMVRFGNVLDSSGSVVPLFREQIESGGPVTVTHPEITRYFMTIPEAASLVLQAGVMARGGEVFVLDMGKPIKILDLAHKMIRLMGSSVKTEGNVEGDIRVEFSGLRPGEKLFEELLITDNARGTQHPRIMCADESSLPKNRLYAVIQSLEGALLQGDFTTVRDILRDADLGYHPSSPVVDPLAEAGSD